MLLTFNNYAEIPSKMHLFYSEAFDTLYAKHDATKSSFKRELKSQLSRDIFKNIFAEFCFYTYFDQKYSFTTGELGKYLNNLNTEEKFDKTAYIDDLVGAVCMLIRDGIDYNFVHRSFQEYFAAFYIQGLDDEQQKELGPELIERSRDNKTLSMLFSMSQNRVEKNIIIPFFEKFEKSSYWDFVLNVYGDIWLRFRGDRIDFSPYHSYRDILPIIEVCALYNFEVSSFYQSDSIRKYMPPDTDELPISSIDVDSELYEILHREDFPLMRIYEFINNKLKELRSQGESTNARLKYIIDKSKNKFFNS